jgi:hypothetical protein
VSGRAVMKELGMTKVGLRYARRIDRAYKRIWKEYLRREMAYVEDVKLSELDSLIEHVYLAHKEVREAERLIMKGEMSKAEKLLSEARLQLSTIFPP